MSFEPTVLINGASELAASMVALLLALRLKKGNGKGTGCVLHRPFYLLALSLFVMSVLNFGWFFGLIHASAVDDLLVAPLFHLVILAVWFYLCMFLSGHDHLFFLIPIFLMSINALFLMKDLAVVCDVIAGLLLMGVFFYVGFIDRHLMKKVSATGMVYGMLIAGASMLAYFTGISYVESFWFVPNAVLFYMLFMMLMEGDICGIGVSGASASLKKSDRHHLPLFVEVAKLGMFVVGLSIFLMLGTLGVHELGHSLAAKSFGCSHSTVFGVGQAVTRVTCEGNEGATAITMGGFILTVLISLLIYFTGHEFSKKLGVMMLAFSMLISVDDFTVLGMPDSVFIVLIFMSAVLLGYGVIQIVKGYEKEYAEFATHKKDACASPGCSHSGQKVI